LAGTLKLKRGEERRIKAGHLWIYADEVEKLSVQTPGGLVHVSDSRGHGLGTAYANPASKIVARMLSKKNFSELKSAWWQERLGQALARRDWAFRTPHYRWVHGEGDKLPGLIVDRFGDDVVLQAHTAGIEAELETIASAIDALVRPANIYINNKANSRRYEGLESYSKVWKGSGNGIVTANEAGIPMQCHALEGQKTGYFYDQRPNREWIGRLCKGRRVLDLFAYVGAFAVKALEHEASEVVSLDASEAALGWAKRNVGAAGFGDRWQGVQVDIMRALPEMAAKGERFDVVICDPPAFVKSRNRLKEGLRGYQKLAMEATRLVKPGGIFCAASCSGLVGSDDFRKATVAGIREAGRGAQIVYEGGAGADHPWLPAMPETRYLKFLGMFLD